MEDSQEYIDDPLTYYLSEIRKVSRLTRAEEILCIKHLRADDSETASARTGLLEANLSLVVAIAERNNRRDIEMMDLIQAGNEGLLQALQTFREGTWDRFVEHATAHIEQAMAGASPQFQQIVVPHCRGGYEEPF